MLKTRVLTALIMVMVVLGAIFGLSNMAFALVAGLLILGIGGWEATHLCSVKLAVISWLYPMGLFLGAFGLWFSSSELLIAPWLTVVAIAWLIPMGWLSHPKATPQPMFTGMLLALLLSGAWLSLVWLHGQTPWLIVWILIIVAAADVGAYFSGRAIGGAKLAPAISPGKTWAGAWGGLFAAGILAPLAGRFLPVDAVFNAPTLALLGVVLAAISIVGDLFISLLKRQAGLKDSSTLLPGHGGILDRLDSVGAALPFFALAIGWLQ